jgi:hypothetical protein
MELARPVRVTRVGMFRAVAPTSYRIVDVTIGDIDETNSPDIQFSKRPVVRSRGFRPKRTSPFMTDSNAPGKCAAGRDRPDEKRETRSSSELLSVSA